MQLCLLPCLLLGSCLSWTYVHINRNEPLRSEDINQLHPGSSKLSDCLAALGAPLMVWPMDHGLALAWGWQEQVDWGLDISVPLADYVDASLSYDSSYANLPGLALFLDESLVLQSIRRGQLRELKQSSRAPALLEARP